MRLGLGEAGPPISTTMSGAGTGCIPAAREGGLLPKLSDLSNVTLLRDSISGGRAWELPLWCCSSVAAPELLFPWLPAPVALAPPPSVCSRWVMRSLRLWGLVGLDPLPGADPTSAATEPGIIPAAKELLKERRLMKGVLNVDVKAAAAAPAAEARERLLPRDGGWG